MTIARVIIPDGPLEAETRLEDLTDDKIVDMLFASLSRERAEAVILAAAKRAGLATTMQEYWLAVCRHRAPPERPQEAH